MVLKSANYIYVVTRTHGLSTHLLKREDLMTLLRAPSFEAFVEGVMKGDYAEKVGLLTSEKATAKDLNKIFSEVYVSRLLYVIKIASGGIKKFLDSFTRRVEVENIKKIIRAKFHGLEITQGDLIPLPRTYSVINYQAMIEAEALDDALNLLGFTKYRGVVNRLSVAREIDSTIPLEAFLDSIYFKNLYKSMKKVPDEPTLKSVVGTEIDFRNIYYLISYKLLDVPQRIMEESVVKPLHRFKDMEISNLIKAREEAIIEVLNTSNYRWLTSSIAQSLEERSIDNLEYELSRLFKGYIDKVGIRNALGLGYVVWYLYSIEYEFRNLTAIAIGKELGWEESEIKVIF